MRHLLTWALRLVGGGKRGASTLGRGRNSDVSKGEVLVDMALSLQRTHRSLVNFARPLVFSTLNHISQMKGSCEANDMYGMAVIEARNNAQLQNLNFEAGSGNAYYKINMVKQFK